MNTSSRTSKMMAAVCQMCSTCDVERNFQICSRLVSQAKSFGAKIAFLPESFDYISETPHHSQENSQSLTEERFLKYAALAQKNDIYISFGGFHERVTGEKKTYNSHILVDNSGKIASIYRKIHLFDVNIPNGPCLQESKFTKPGNCVESPVVNHRYPSLHPSYHAFFPEPNLMHFLNRTLL
eukprot:Sdes_comp20907_c0_seq3m18129